MNIFFDLDGTLIDARKRMYELFQHLVPQSEMPFDEYWQLKRNKTAHISILHNHFQYTQPQIEAFEKEWMGKIETNPWLAMDKPFPGVDQMLQKLSKDNNLYIATARQFENIAIAQINSFGWTPYIKKVFVTNQLKQKHNLILEEILVEKNDWFVGDTGKDIQTGKILGVKTAAVCSGFLSKDVLETYHPDVIVEKVTDLKFN